MDADWREWAKRQGEVVSLPGPGGDKCYTRKPMAVLAASHKIAVWMDVDTEVMGDISGIWTKYRPSSGPAMALDLSKYGEGMGQCGVVVCNHGDPIIETWAKGCHLPPKSTMPDQIVFHQMGIRGGQLPPIYNKMKSQGHSPDDLVRHWTMHSGKDYIRSLGITRENWRDGAAAETK